MPSSAGLLTVDSGAGSLYDRCPRPRSVDTHAADARHSGDRAGGLGSGSLGERPARSSVQEAGAVVGVDAEGREAGQGKQYQEGAEEGCGGNVGAQDVGHFGCEEQRGDGGGEEAGLQAAQPQGVSRVVGWVRVE
jgi:hypothetical protein